MFAEHIAHRHQLDGLAIQLQLDKAFDVRSEATPTWPDEIASYLAVSIAG
jgi:hypothetical protein